jgi:hypothetical protein
MSQMHKTLRFLARKTSLPEIIDLQTSLPSHSAEKSQSISTLLVLALHQKNSFQYLLKNQKNQKKSKQSRPNRLFQRNVILQLLKLMQRAWLLLLRKEKDGSKK